MGYVQIVERSIILTLKKIDPFHTRPIHLNAIRYRALTPYWKPPAYLPPSFYTALSRSSGDRAIPS